MYQSIRIAIAQLMKKRFLFCYAMIISLGIPGFFIANDPTWLLDPIPPIEMALLVLGAVVGILLLAVVVHAIAQNQQNLIVRWLTKDLPLRMEGVWYTGMWYRNDCREEPLTVINEVCFNPFKVNILNSNSDHLINGLIPAFVIGNDVGLYAVTRHYRDPQSGSDLCLWDNGMLVDLRLCSIEDKETARALIKANEELTNLRIKMHSTKHINPLSVGELDESSSAAN